MNKLCVNVELKTNRNRIYRISTEFISGLVHDVNLYASCKEIPSRIHECGWVCVRARVRRIRGGRFISNCNFRMSVARRARINITA